MMNKRRSVMAVVVASSLVLLAACASTAGSGGTSAGGAAASVPGEGKVQGGGSGAIIAFSQEGMENGWRTENTNSITTSLKAAGYKVVWQQAGGDESKQVAQVQNLLQMKPALLVVEPAEQQAATPIAGLADAAKVPMIMADRSIGVAPGTGMYKTLITVNWEKVGEALGKAAINTLTAKTGKDAGNIVELAGVMGSAPQIAMDKGFQTIVSSHPGIKIVAVQDGKNERGPGLQIMEDFLTKYPKGKIDLVWAQSGEMAIGALKAIQSSGRNELLGAILSKDGELASIAQVANGNFATDCSNTPYFGPIIVPYIKKILAGKAVPTAPDKPFTCFESLTSNGKADVKALYADMLKSGQTFASR